MSHPFGDLVSQHLHRKHGLSQFKLAAGILQSPAVISVMCKGKRLTGPQARERVVSIISWLHQQGVLVTLDEANALLNAAGMASLNGNSSVEVALVRSLQALDRSGLTSHTYTSVQNAVVRRTNLPARLTSFVGREQEIAELTEQVKTARLLTLVGAGGVGKTRLSLEVARNLLDAFSDGVWLVELAPLSDPALLAQTVANVFKLPEQPDRTHLDMLVGYLEARHLLLILDNCEHLIDSCASLVEALLQRCPDLHVLTTSRETLRVSGEVTHRVPSLSTPDVDMPPDSLLRYESVRLFRERAITSQSMFEWSPSNTAAVALICSRLDGVPLAIELAVARLNVLSAEQIAERLSDRFNLLISGSRTALPRHHTLHAAIAWSYDLLTTPERELLAQLSVFAGGFTAEAAEFVSGQSDALTLLSNLVDKSLVMAEVKDKAVRYRLLETIRQFAYQRLLEWGDAEKVRDQHLKYFLQLAERAEPELRRADQIAWLDRLETELGNFRAALEWSLEGERHVEAGLRLSVALTFFWHIRGYRREGVQWLERALSAEALTRRAKPLSQTRALARVEALNATGLLLGVQASYAKQFALCEEGLALSRELGDRGRHSMALALLNLADAVCYGQQNYSQARALSEDSLALYREAGDKLGVADCLYILGDSALALGDYERAREHFEESLALRRETGDKDGLAYSHLLVGKVAFLQGDLNRAAVMYETSLALFDEVDNQWAVGIVLSASGRLAQAQGYYEQAIRYSEQALTIGQDAGHQGLIAVSQDNLGAIAWSQGDYERAAQHYGEALTGYREVAVKREIVIVLCGLGSVVLAQGDDEQAVKRFEEALTMGRNMEEGKFTMAKALFGLGRVAQVRSDFAAAHTLHTEALALLRGMHETWAVADALDALAAVACAQGQAQRAARLFGAAETLYELIRFTISPFERDAHERAVASAQSQLNEATFAAAWAEGQAMTLEQAIDYALSEKD